MDRRRALLVLASAALAAPRAHGDDAVPLAFAELYGPRRVLGIELSTKTQSLTGRAVKILGFMAPPLKPDVTFFVLTRAPVALCPFCNSDADWPSDIVVVYPTRHEAWSLDGTPVAVAGTLEIGSRIDPQTGFVSLVRVVDARISTLQ